MPMSVPCIVIDRTHLGRRASGIERITRELFSDDSLSPLATVGTGSGGGRAAMILRQLVLNPIEALVHPGSVWVFSGYPPSPAFGALSERSVLYVHDLFLVQRTAELNYAGRFYLAPNFRAALRRLRFFLANSATTAAALSPYIDPRSTLALYRPPARDVLGLSSVSLMFRDWSDGPLRIGMIGTIEPRKNYRAAAAICREVATILARPVELHIVGRGGWGADEAMLRSTPGVHLHGFVDDARIPSLVRQWTVFLSTSHDEGLGLPLLEVQHAGLPVVAPDSPVFREVLGDSGTFVDLADLSGAALAVADLVRQPRLLRRAQAAAPLNIERWNALAAADRAGVVDMLGGMLAAAQAKRT